MATLARSVLTPAQFEILELFWENGELGVAQAWALLAQRRRVARNTVQTQLRRLEDKGWLVARAQANAFYYRAGVDRDHALNSMVNGLVEMAFAGSTSNLVLALLQDKPLAAEEAQRLRDLIDASEREGK